MDDYNLLPNLEQSSLDKRNDRPKRSYTKDEVYYDDLGYQRFNDNHALVLNKDGSARRSSVKTAPQRLEGKTREERRRQKQLNMLQSEADIKMRDLLKRLAQYEFDVVREMVEIYYSADATLDQRIRILSKLMDFAFPKLAVLNTNEQKQDGFSFNISLGSPEGKTEEQKRKDMIKVLKQ